MPFLIILPSNFPYPHRAGVPPYIWRCHLANEPNPLLERSNCKYLLSSQHVTIFLYPSRVYPGLNPETPLGNIFTVLLSACKFPSAFCERQKHTPNTGKIKKFHMLCNIGKGAAASTVRPPRAPRFFSNSRTHAHTAQLTAFFSLLLVPTILPCSVAPRPLSILSPVQPRQSPPRPSIRCCCLPQIRIGIWAFVSTSPIR